MNLTASKHSLVCELFVRTVDENYVTARWCAINHFNTDFLWLSVHALEKYLKAVLLLNGKSSKNSQTDGNRYSHDIVRLYADVKILAGQLLPSNLVKPSNLDDRFWTDQTPEQFIEHLLENGNANNRYLTYGYIAPSEDIHMLDTMVFKIRRLICDLDECAFPNEQPDQLALTNRDLLIKHPKYPGDLLLPLDKLVSAKEQSPTRFAALNLNFEFAPSDYAHESIQAGISFSNPAIIRRILDPLESDDSQWAKEGVELANWFLANVQVPKGTSSDPGVSKQIQAAIDAAKAKHNIS